MPTVSTFPLKLMEILDMEELSHILSWLPHGRGFTIHDKHKFAEEVLPEHFKVAKFTSFTRRMNRWNFTLQKAAPRQSNYFHPMFIRGDVESCLRMKPKPQVYRTTSKSKSGRRRTTSPSKKMNKKTMEPTNEDTEDVDLDNVNSMNALLPITPEPRLSPPPLNTKQNTVPLPSFMLNSSSSSDDADNHHQEQKMMNNNTDMNNMHMNMNMNMDMNTAMQQIQMQQQIGNSASGHGTFIPNTMMAQGNTNTPIILQTMPFPLTTTTQYQPALQTVFIPTTTNAGIQHPQIVQSIHPYNLNMNMNFTQNIGPAAATTVTPAAATTTTFPTMSYGQMDHHVNILPNANVCNPGMMMMADSSSQGGQDVMVQKIDEQPSNNNINNELQELQQQQEQQQQTPQFASL